MDVLVTGAFGRCSTALIDHLHDDVEYDFAYYNRSDRPADHPYGGYETIVGGVGNADALHRASEERDAMVHMAAYPYTDGDWRDIFEPNIVSMDNALEVARREEFKSFVFVSSNHAVGRYEEEHAPELYALEYGLVLDHTDPVRPDSFYGASRSFGENLGRYYVKNYNYPKRFYALRVGSVRWPE